MKRLLLAGLLSLSATGAAQAVPALLAATPDGLHPIAIYEGNSFFQPARDPAEQKLLGKDLLKRTTQLPLFFNGEQRSLFQLKAFQSMSKGCTGPGLWTGKPQDTLPRPMLAFSPDFPGPRHYVGSYPSSSFNAIANQLTRKIYQAHKVPAAQLASLKVRRIDPFTLLNGTRVLVSVESDIYPAERSCPEYSLLLIFEKVGRRYQPLLERFRHNTANSCANYRLLGTFASSPTIDKIVIQGNGPDASWFDLFQLPSQVIPTGSLKQIFHGGGYSCKK